MKIPRTIVCISILLVNLVKCIPIVFRLVYRKVFKMNKKDLAGQVVLITGAGQGLGKELARQFCCQGCTVVCVDMNASTNAATVDMLKKSGHFAYGYACDVSEKANVIQLANKVLKEIGRVDILVNNAGILMPKSSPGAHLEDKLLSIMKINTMSHFWTVQAFLPGMLKQDHGHIVAISSMASMSGLGGAVTYSASKAAVAGLMMSLDNELYDMGRKNIKCTCVHPYFIDTQLIDECVDKNSSFPPLTVKDAAYEILEGVMQERNCFVVPRQLQTSAFIIKFLPRDVYQFLRMKLMPKMYLEPHELCSIENYKMKT